MKDRERPSHGEYPFAFPSTPDDHHPQGGRITGSEAVRSIWFHPREVIFRIMESNPQMYVSVLICLYGVENVLDRSVARGLGERMPLGGILLVACVAGPLIGFLMVWLYSHLLSISGKWLDGRADPEELKTAIAWAQVPIVAVLALWIPLILIMGKDVFTLDVPQYEENPTIYLATSFIEIAQLILGLWAFVLLCNTVAEVQQYHSAWRGLINVVLAGILFAIILVGLGMVILLMLGRGIGWIY